MTAIFNTSVFSSDFPAATQQENKKAYRSSNYNIYTVVCVDFDGMPHTYEVEAARPAQAHELAVEAAKAEGVSVDFGYIYSIQ